MRKSTVRMSNRVHAACVHTEPRTHSSLTSVPAVHFQSDLPCRLFVLKTLTAEQKTGQKHTEMLLPGSGLSLALWRAWRGQHLWEGSGWPGCAAVAAGQGSRTPGSLRPDEEVTDT